MQNKVQLYIENQKLDLFSDESIEINSKIQDLRDIGKIFTDFTQALTYQLHQLIITYLATSTIIILQLEHMTIELKR